MNSSSYIKNELPSIESLEKLFTQMNIFLFIRKFGTPIQYEYISPSVEQLGLNVEDFYKGKPNYVERIHPEDYKRIQGFHSQMYANKVQNFQIEYRIKDKLNQYRWFQENTNIIYNSNNNPVYLKSLLVDISNLKRLEEELHFSEQNIKSILQESLYGILIIQNDQFVFANETASKIMGYPQDSILSWSIQDFLNIVHPDDIDDLMSKVKQRFSNFNWELNVRFRIFTQEKKVCWTKQYSRRITYNGKPANLITILDISERINAQIALQEIEQTYGNLIENINEAIFISDENYEITYVNKAFREIIGYNQEEIMYKDIFSFLFKSYSLDQITHLKQLWKRLSPEKIELIVLNKQGEHLNCWVSPRGLYNPKGEFTGTITILTDISARKQMELKLRENEQKYRTLFEYANDAIFLLENGIFIDCNQKVLDVFEVEREDIIGANPAQYSPKYQPNGALSETLANKYIKAAEQGTPQFFEWIHINSSQKSLNFEISLNTIQVDEKDYVLAICRNITERKEMENALASEKDRLDVTLQSIAEGVISTDTSGDILLMNKVAEDLTGWTEYEARHSAFVDVFSLSSKNPDISLKNPVRNVLNNEKPFSFPKNTILIAKDGTKRIITGVISPIQNSADELQGVVLVFRDVTEKRKLEEEFFKSQKMESVGILAGGIAHDFNNILTSILGNLSIAKLEMEQVNPNVLSILEEAEKASLRANKLTKQLLTFSKGGAPIKKTTSLHDTIYETVRFALRGSNVRYFIEVADDLLPVDVDEGQISQVINNIVINADQAMPEGGNIIISAENYKYNIPTTNLPQDRKYIQISIMDQGIGIPEDHIPKIFDPYFTTKEEGTGLGLAVCYSIIKNHDGLITVDSKLDEGTIFRIYLPASEKTIESKPKSSPQTLLKKGKGKVLVMDDESHILKLLEKMLKRLGYTVTKTQEGKQFLNYAKEAVHKGNNYEFYIMDLTIPGGMGGKDTISHLLEIDADAKAIVTSGYTTGQVMSNYKNYGFSGVLIKPFTIQDLSKILNSLS